MKGDEIAQLVNELDKVAQTYGQTEQLRSQISELVATAIRKSRVLDEQQERQRFADFMVSVGFAEQATAPPKPPVRHYRSSNVEACWEAWVGALLGHGYTNVNPPQDHPTKSRDELGGISLVLEATSQGADAASDLYQSTQFTRSHSTSHG